MTKKNYIQTVKSFNPQRLFTFSSVNSFINYDGRELIGAIFDENTSAMLTPRLTYLKNAPKKINLFGPSVIENEKENQSLAISGVSKLAPYNVSYNSISPATQEYTSSSFSVQFKVPKQSLNNETVIEEYTTPKATITTDSGETFQVETILYAEYWYAIIEPSKIVDVNSFSVSMSYKNRVFHTAEYVLERHDTYSDRFKPSYNNMYNEPTDSNMLPVYNSDMPQLPNNAPSPGSFIWAYGLDDTKPVYMITENVVRDVEGVPTNVEQNVLYAKDDIVLYGKIHEQIDITKYSTNTIGNGAYNSRMTDVIEVGTLRFSVFYYDSLKLMLTNRGTTKEGYAANTSRSFDISTDTGYTLTVTHSLVDANDNRYLTKCYLNGKLIYNSDLYTDNSYMNSDIRIGSADTIRTVSFYAKKHNFWRSAYLTYYHNNVTVFIDNVAVFDHVISARDAYLMYIRTMTYEQLLLSFRPYMHLVFNKPLISYNNQFSSDRFEVNNFNTRPVNINSEVYDVGTHFKGCGSLIHKNQSTNYSNTTSLIDYSQPFSIVTWISTTTRNFLLFSERNKSNPESGLSIFVEDGYITYRYNETKYRTSCFISDGRFRMLCMSYDGSNIRTFVPQEHNSTKPASLHNGRMYPRYVTLLNDKGIHADVDVTLCAFTVFRMSLDTQQFTDLYNESIDFSVAGTVLYKNLPAYATVRIIEHSTGKLLDTQYTDGEGMFKYTSIYKNDIDLITLNNGRIQVLGTLQSTTR